MRARGWLLAGIAVLAAVLLLGRGITALVVDRAWYAAMDLESLWRERVIDTVLLQGGAWLAGSLFAFVNLQGVRGTILAVAVPARVANLELTAMIPSRRLVWITVVLAVLIGLALAAPLTDWSQVALARHGVPFGEYEGFLDKDLGFYVYWLPLEETLYLWALVTLVTVTTVVLVFYALTRSLRLDGRRVIASTHVRRHLSVLGALVLLLLAWSFRLDAFDLLRDGSGPDGLFMRVDHVVTLRVDLALAILAAIAAPLLLRAGWMGQTRMALITLSVVLVSSVGLRQVLPIVLSRGDRIGDPGHREADYVVTRALVSRRAYDVDGIRVPDQVTRIGVASTPRVPLEAIGRAGGVWDASLLGDPAAGGSGRPLLEASPVAWVSTPDGSPGALIVRRPVLATERWRITLLDLGGAVPREVPLPGAPAGRDDVDPLLESGEPLVGPGLAGHVVVADPAGTVRGARLATLGQRIAHAWAIRDPSLLSIDPVLAEPPTLVHRRDVRERVRAVAPVFAQGGDVLPLLHDGRLHWTLELYSASAGYPLSQRWMLAGDVRSYFRHAATALVDAGSGQVRLVAVTRPDPVARTWMERLPGLWVEAGQLPPSLVAQLPPVTDGAMAQLRTFARYGSRAEGSVPRQLLDSALAAGGPSAHLVAVGARTAPAWSVALLDASEQMAGVATAVGGAERATWWDPASAWPASGAAARARWSTIADRLRLSLDSVRATLPDAGRRDPRIRRSRIRTVMTDGGPVHLQALFTTRADGANSLVAVAALIGDTTTVGPTLAELVLPHRGTGAAGAEVPGSAAMSGTGREAALVRLYDSMRDAAQRGDWARFGSAFDSLGLLLGRGRR
jgi:uncharacterized membrane protein (UPF0182 family)